jgi:hypothetical protein
MLAQLPQPPQTGGGDRLQNLFETMVYHTDRGRRLAPSSPLLLPERVPVMIEGFDQAV